MLPAAHAVPTSNATGSQAPTYFFVNPFSNIAYGAAAQAAGSLSFRAGC
jgi:hypothetical protein